MKKLLPGIIFATLGLAALEGLSGIITSSAAYIQSSINLKTVGKQVEANKLAEILQNEEQNSSVHAIGFNIDPMVEEDDYE